MISAWVLNKYFTSLFPNGTTGYPMGGMCLKRDARIYYEWLVRTSIIACN